MVEIWLPAIEGVRKERFIKRSFEDAEKLINKKTNDWQLHENSKYKIENGKCVLKAKRKKSETKQEEE